MSPVPRYCRRSVYFAYLDAEPEQCRSSFPLGWRCCRHQLRQFPEVLGCRCELELFGCTFGCSETHNSQTNVSLEVGKQHLDFLPLDERRHLGVGFVDVAGDISCGLMYRSQHLSGRLGRTTLRLQQGRHNWQWRNRRQNHLLRTCHLSVSTNPRLGCVGRPCGSRATNPASRLRHGP